MKLQHRLTRDGFSLQCLVFAMAAVLNSAAGTDTGTRSFPILEGLGVLVFSFFPSSESLTLSLSALGP